MILGVCQGGDDRSVLFAGQTWAYRSPGRFAGAFRGPGDSDVSEDHIAR